MNLQEALQRINKCRHEQLTILDLSNCSLTEIPDELFTLTQLTELKLGHWSDYSKQHKNNLSQLSPQIAQLVHLQNLDLSSNELSELPNEIAQLRQLQTLDAVNNKLRSLPTSMGLLVQLQSLDVSNNHLTALHDSIAHLPRLQKLNLSKNQLSSLPSDLSAWQHLQRLDLSNNLFKQLPPQLCPLPQLEQLSMSANQLSEVPDELNQCKQLKVAYFNNNEIKQLPGEWGNLLQLKRLYLNSNLLETLPASMSAAVQLQVLDARNNQLDEVPWGISLLTNLTYLDLRKNQISQLPAADFAKLKKLELLDVRDNLITQLPVQIAALPQLQYIYLSDNPLESPPPEIAHRGLTAIRNYFIELEKSNESDYLYEIKLLLVGEGRVGKTSLSKALTQPDYQLTDQQSTEGIDIQTWTIPHRELNISKDFKINIWDFGGQEIYHATHQFFLTKRSMYILVTESRKEDRHEDFYYWLNIIRLLGGRSPVILVLNKCDQPTKDLPIKEYRRAFNNIVDFSKVSCHPDYRATISSLKRKIVQQLHNRQLLPHLGSRLPKVWVDIRAKLDSLCQEGYEYISYDDYLKICKKYYQNEESAAFLSSFFHDLGVVLHFQDDPVLKNTLFLNHEWVTQGVYAVLDNQIIKNRHGNFTDDDLTHIWQDERYNKRRKELFALMRNEKFELCMELKPGHYLAPQLLPVDEIEYEWNEQAHQLRYEYHYQFMPKGILTRLIVKLHRYIHEQTYWRYGALLVHNEAQAMVKELYFDRKISITLQGNNQLDLLYLLRQTIEQMNESFNNLSLTELVQCNCSVCKSSTKPHFYRLDVLQRYLQRNKPFIDCEKSLQSVRVRDIMANTFTNEELQQDIFRSDDELSDWKMTDSNADHSSSPTLPPIEEVLSTSDNNDLPPPSQATTSTVEQPIYEPSQQQPPSRNIATWATEQNQQSSSSAKRSVALYVAAGVIVLLLLVIAALLFLMGMFSF